MARQYIVDPEYHRYPAGNVVYFIMPNKSRRVKIGWSSNFAARLKDIQATNHVPITVLLTMPGDARLEQDLHDRFSEERTHNEWFRLSDRIKAFIASKHGRTMPMAGSFSIALKPKADRIWAVMCAVSDMAFHDTPATIPTRLTPRAGA